MVTVLTSCIQHKQFQKVATCGWREINLLCIFIVRGTQEELGEADIVPGSLKIGGTFSQGQRNFKLESFEVATDDKHVQYYKAYCIQVSASEDWVGTLS